MNILSICNLSKQYGSNIVLQDINVDIDKNDVIAIIGPSGAGKSTFLRSINYLDPPTTGEIYLNGELITPKNIPHVRKKIGIVFKDYRLFSHLTVLENIYIAPRLCHNLSKINAKENAMKLLRSFGLAEKADCYPHRLSDEHKLRTAIVRCLAMEPEVILFEDSINTLDLTSINSIMSIIRNTAQTEKTLLIETNDMELIRNVANRILYIDEKGIYEDGSPDSLFNLPQKEKTKQFIEKISSYFYHIKSRDYDFVELYAGIEKYCIRNYVVPQTAIKLKVIIEEIVTQLLMPIYEQCIIQVKYVQLNNTFKVNISYKDKDINVLSKSENFICVQLLSKYAKNLYHHFDGELNTIYVEI